MNPIDSKQRLLVVLASTAAALGALGFAEQAPRAGQAGRPGASRGAPAYLKTEVQSWAPASAPQRRVRGTIVITDLEGNGARLRDALKAGVLRLVDGRLDFAHPGDARQKLVFNGDIPDHGPETLALVDLLSDLQRRYPDRVSVNWGNHELKYLGLQSGLRDLEKLKGNYAKRLERHVVETETGVQLPSDPKEKRAFLQQHNTLATRLEHWLEDHSARGALGLHRQQLAKRRGKPVSVEDAAADYLQRMLPGGSFFSFLQRGTVATVDGPTLYCHGGLSERNLGWVPGKLERAPSLRQQVTELNEWGASELAKVEQALRRGADPPLTLRNYGECQWDPGADKGKGQGKGVAFALGESVIYSDRSISPDHNFRLPPEPVRRFAATDRISTEVNGHSPAGDVPTPLSRAGYLKVMGDTSYGKGHSVTQVDARGNVWVEGTTREGAPVTYRVSPAGSRYVGNLTRDGYTVVGRGRVNGQTQYVLTKYHDGYLISEQHVTRQQLKERGIEPPEIAQSAALDDHRDILVRSLRAKRKSLWSPDDVVTRPELLANKIPVVISGASNFGKYPAAPRVVDREVRRIAAMLDPARAGSVTGGTDCGVEKIFHRAARRNQLKVVGFIHEATVPGDVKTVKDLVISAGANHWLDPLLAAETVARENRGFVAFIGGGQVVADGIKAAEQSHTPYYVMRKDPSMEGTGGASGVAAAAHPDRAFGSAEELAALMRRDGFGAILRR